MNWFTVFKISIFVFFISIGTPKLIQDASGEIGNPLNLSPTTGDARDIQIVSFDNNIYVVWREASGADDQIQFRVSKDGGATWIPPLSQAPRILSDVAIDAKTPRMVASGNDVYIVWEGDFPDSTVIFRHSGDGGSTFDSQVTITSVPSKIIIRPNIAIEGNTAYVVWIQETSSPTAFNLFFSKSTDNSFFTTPISLTSGVVTGISADVNTANTPQIFATGDNVYVSWIGDHLTPNNADGEDEIFFIASNNRGSNFGSVKNISENDVNNRTYKMTGDGNNVYFIWIPVDPSSQDASFRRSFNGGSSFEPEIPLTNTGGKNKPDVIVINGVVHLVWIAQHFFFDDFLEYTRSLDNGGSFENIQELGDAVIRTDPPNFSPSGNEILITYTAVGQPFIEVFYSLSRNGGQTFDNPVSLGPNRIESAEVSQGTISNAKIYGIWEEDTAFSSPFEQVFFNFSIITCSPPPSGDWTVTSSCIMPSSPSNPTINDGDLIVQNNSVLTIPAGVSLDIDFSMHKITVESGSGILIKAGGSIT